MPSHTNQSLLNENTRLQQENTRLKQVLAQAGDLMDGVCACDKNGAGTVGTTGAT